VKTTTKKDVHWTQKPENKKRLSAIRKAQALKRKTRFKTVVKTPRVLKMSTDTFKALAILGAREELEKTEAALRELQERRIVLGSFLRAAAKIRKP
jgi:hypothetical protein